MITHAIPADNSMTNLFRIPLRIQKWNARIVKKRILNECCQHHVFPLMEMPFQLKDHAVLHPGIHEQIKPVVTGNISNVHAHFRCVL